MVYYMVYYILLKELKLLVSIVCFKSVRFSDSGAKLLTGRGLSDVKPQMSQRNIMLPACIIGVTWITASSTV